MSEGMPMDEIEAQIETLRAEVKVLHKNSDTTRDESLPERIWQRMQMIGRRQRQ
jgi:hypothetical protein